MENIFQKYKEGIKGRETNLTEEEDKKYRQIIVNSCKNMIGVVYKYGAEVDLGTDKDTKELDCSELVEWAYFEAGITIPDGSQNQFNATLPTSTPKKRRFSFFWKR